MPTVAKAIQELPVFAQARIVAGHTGLDREIRWVHIVDIPDPSAWVHGGELLLTTAFGLKDDSHGQKQLIPLLAEKGLAGLVIAVGRYLHQTPNEMIHQADALSFPLIELPFDVPFVEVTKAIIDRIESERFSLQQKSLSIHATLTQLVIEGGGLDALAKTLANLVQRSISVEDEHFELLAHATCGTVDKARQESIAQGRTPHPLLIAIEQTGLSDEIRRSRRRLHVPPIPEHGMTMDRIIAPIVATGEVHGYVWIIAGDSPLSDLDFLAIEHAATVAALILVKERAVRDAENRLRGGFLTQLLAPDFELTSSEREEQSRRYDFDPSLPHQVLVIRSDKGLVSLARAAENFIRSRKMKTLIAEQANVLVIVVESSHSGNVATLADVLHQNAQSIGASVQAGLGREVAQGENLRQSYVEALEALRLGPMLNSGNWLIKFEELGFLHWLDKLPDQLYRENPYQDRVRALAGHPDLLETLEVYLDNGRSPKKTAEQLYLHRNTLSYRLKRIEAICQVSLFDPKICLNLHLALKSQKLRST
jgi:purine catabolism regulator